MSSRTRSRFVPYTALWKYGSGNLPNESDLGVFWDSESTQGGTFAPTPTSNLRYDRILDESIYDWVGNRADYNSVSHTKREAAMFSGKINYNYGSWDPPVLTVALRGGVMMNNPPTLPSINWGGLVDELAQQVQGRSGPSVMLLLVLKELGSTIRMVRNPFSLLKRNWRKQVKLKPASALAKEGANVWLEQLYGWKSLFTDVTDTAKVAGTLMIQCANTEVEGATWTRYRSVVKDTGTLPNVYGLNTPTENHWKDLSGTLNGLASAAFGLKLSNIRWNRTAAVTCRTSSIYARASSLTARILQGIDVNTWYGVRDFLWEVVPFSFVVDWFIDTRGLWAPTNQALISAAGASHIGYSTKVEVGYDASICAGTWPAAHSGSIPGWYNRHATSSSPRVFNSASRGKIIQYTRTSGWPPVDCPMYFQGWGLNLSQWATTAALITQKLVK